MSNKSLTLKIKELEKDTYEVKCRGFDFHIRWELDGWQLDAYKSRVQDSDKAHIGDTITCASLSEAIGECATLTKDWITESPTN